MKLKHKMLIAIVVIPIVISAIIDIINEMDLKVIKKQINIITKKG